MPSEVRTVASENLGEAAARWMIREKIGDTADVHIESCVAEDCEQSFIGVTAEDFAAHLVNEHPFYRGSAEQLLRTVTRAAIHEKQDGGVD